MSKPSYRKITGDKKMSTATVVVDKELEESIRDVSPEGDKKSVEESASEVKSVVEFVAPPVDKDISLESRETLNKIASGAYHIPEHWLTDTQKEQPAQKPKRPSKAHILALRQRDRSFNKTCAACGERKLLKFMDGGKADICDTCRK